MASFGYASGVHYQNEPEWAGYTGPLSRGELPLHRGLRLTPRQRLIREMILQLKTGRIDAGYFRQKFQAEILADWADVWGEYRNEGYVETDGDDVRVTREGLLRVDGLLPAFFEPQFQNVRYT